MEFYNALKALIHSDFIEEDASEKTCPACGATVRADACYCGFCGSRMDIEPFFRFRLVLAVLACGFLLLSIPLPLYTTGYGSVSMVTSLSRYFAYLYVFYTGICTVLFVLGNVLRSFKLSLLSGTATLWTLIFWLHECHLFKGLAAAYGIEYASGIGIVVYVIGLLLMVTDVFVVLVDAAGNLEAKHVLPEDKRMKCESCGRIIDDPLKFCPCCGKAPRLEPKRKLWKRIIVNLLFGIALLCVAVGVGSVILAAFMR